MGCSDATSPTGCDPAAPGPSLEPAKRDSLPPPPTDFRTLDDEWAEIARQVPGRWGGVVLDGGILTIYLVDPSKRAQAVAALFALGVGAPYDIRQARVKQGRWDFAQLYDWYRYINVRVGWPEGLVLTDIDEGRNRVVYGVQDDNAKARLEAVVEPLGLPCELVVVEVTGPVVQLAGAARR